MLKYTLGALAAAVILLGTGFVILAQVNDGGADQGPAPNIIVSVNDEIVWPEELLFKRGEITELSLQNHSSATRGARLEGEGVEQLPELPVGDTVASRDPSPRINLEASPGRADSQLVRFDQPGEYTLYIVVTGVFFPGVPVRVIVE